jgi:hypothetical protein
MFLVSLVVGIGTAKTVNGPVLLFGLAALAVFLTRYPLSLAIKGWQRSRTLPDTWRWVVIYAGLALGLGVLLLIWSRLWGLLALGGVAGLLLALYLWQVARRAEMSVVGELLGVAGLALGAPGVYAVGTGRFDSTALVLWALNFLYFGGSVFYVRLRVREQPRRLPPGGWWGRLAAARITILYHLAALALVAVFVHFGLTSLLAALAFVPMVCKAFQGVLAWPGQVNVRRVGMVEVAHAVAFAVLLIVAYQ